MNKTLYMHNLPDNYKKEKIPEPYNTLASQSSFYTSSMSDPSVQSTVSSSISSQRFGDQQFSSSIISNEQYQQYQQTEDITGQFDLIDSLDYDDIDDSLMDHERIHQQRETLIQELYNSEKEYLATLNLIVDQYILPLRKYSKQKGFLSTKKVPCSQREILSLFGNLETIRAEQMDNLANLDKRLSIWGPTQIISDVIQNWFNRLQMCYPAYFENYGMSVKTYDNLNGHQPFKKFIEATNRNVNLGDASLLSLLQTPVTRIQRYEKIVSNLTEHTSTIHPDYVGLLQCRSYIQNLLEEFKPRMDAVLNIDKVYKIHNAMTGCPFSISAKRRLYLKNIFTSPSSHEERTYFLFSDVLVYVKPSQSTYQYKGHVVLTKAKVRTIPPEKGMESDWAIEITPFPKLDSLDAIAFKSGPTVHIIRTLSQKTQQEWMGYLGIAIKSLGSRPSSIAS